MSQPLSITPPSSILLATDLGARCDRALGRAALLARHWNARLVVVTVAATDDAEQLRRELLPPPHWARPGTAIDDAERELHRDLEGCGVDVEAHVESGDTGPALLRACEQHDCDLIVMGTTRSGLLLPARLGSTVRWLARHASQPLLVVHDRPRHLYQHLAFAHDFSRSAHHAQTMAAAWFGDTATTAAAVHGADLPSLGLMDAGDRRGELVKEMLEEIRAQARLALDASGLPEGLRANTRTVVEQMEPARLVHEYVRSRGADLVSIGSHGRSALSEVLLGSVAQRILETSRSDLLLVRRPRD